jgi:feruloyl esterase
MDKSSSRWGAFLKLAAGTTAAAFVIAATTAATSADTPAPSRTNGSFDLSTTCRPAAVRAAVGNLSTKVTVKQIANGPRFDGGTRLVPATDRLPAFCQVTGSFVTNPETGKTANFLATLPANWNGKYLQLGCSGHCGQFAVSDPSQPQATITTQGQPYDTIVRGYAAFATDEGHEGFSGGTWAVKGPGQVDQDAVTDLYYRADKVLSGMGKEFTAAFYGQASGAPQKIARSYFNGCSGGGRDAFVAASYFPEAFDGIIGGSAYNGAGAAFQFAGIPSGQLRSPGAVVPASLIALIDPIVKAQCDGLDGVKDGLIQNPGACNFRPDRDLPKCTAGSPAGQCFTREQIETVSMLLSAVTDERGNVIQPGFSVSEVQAASFLTPPRPTDLSVEDPFPGSDTGAVNGGYWPLADAYLKVFVHKNDPNFFTRELFSFRSGGPGKISAFHVVAPSSEVALAKREASMGIGHFPENFDPFIRQDRKFLMWHNLSDQVLTPYMSINFYKQLAARHGGYDKLQRNVRLFSLPGTPHCSMGGIGPNSFDALTALENWVEKGIAPDALPAKLYPANAMGFKDFGKVPTRTMPLCKFPTMARYKGTGSVNDGANWSCPASDKSMLRVGESGRQAGVIE